MTELESAVACYQNATGLPIVIHDLTHQLWRELPLRQFKHSHPNCDAVKKSPQGHQCTRFEITAFRREAHRWRHGRLHRCHAGFTELAMPVFEAEELLFVLFTGPAQIENSSDLDCAAPRTSSSDRGYRKSALPTIRTAQLQMLREHLHQLGARLRCWVQDQHVWIPESASTKSARIRKYINDHCTEPIKLDDLAAMLSLSPERTRHVIKEECGANFSTLLAQARLKAASSLLLNSDLPVGIVAERCGLPDPSGFNRAFKKVYRMTPRQWRQRHSA